MKGRVVAVNLIVLVIYSTIIHLTVGKVPEYESISPALFRLMWAIALHALLCLLIARLMYHREKDVWGSAWLFSAGIVLLVGFSSCLGSNVFYS